MHVQIPFGQCGFKFAVGKSLSRQLNTWWSSRRIARRNPNHYRACDGCKSAKNINYCSWDRRARRAYYFVLLYEDPRCIRILSRVRVRVRVFLVLSLSVVVTNLVLDFLKVLDCSRSCWRVSSPPAYQRGCCCHDFVIYGFVFVVLLLILVFPVSCWWPKTRRIFNKPHQDSIPKDDICHIPIFKMLHSMMFSSSCFFAHIWS